MHLSAFQNGSKLVVYEKRHIDHRKPTYLPVLSVFPISMFVYWLTFCAELLSGDESPQLNQFSNSNPEAQNTQDRGGPDW